MKILWLSHLVPYPPKAGVLLRSHYLVKELSRYHQIDLLAFNQRSLIEPYFTSYDEGTKKASQILKGFCKNVQFFDSPMDKGRYRKYSTALYSLLTGTAYNINWLKDERYESSIMDWHKNNKYDVIHADTISLAPYIEQIKGPVLSLDHHNVESHMLLRRSTRENNLFKKFYFQQEAKKVKKLEERYCPKFHTNLTCSNLDSERFKTFIPKARFQEIPNGVDIDTFKPSAEECRSHDFIFIGTLDWYPNDRAVRYLAFKIWPLLKSSYPQATINIIGSGASKDLIDFSENEPGFNLLGFVDDLKPYLEKATAYLCPIDDGGGTKLKLLDAFASGKAVIAHKVACEGLNVKDEKQVLIANTPLEYMKQIDRIISNRGLRVSLEQNAREHVEKQFSFRSIGKKLAEHFENLHLNEGILECVE
ncbi:hypothetical protein A3765_15040 [Oleiphilus sp. HI0130]|nr:hypothetical protein A3765_15040 [Oleiphilus sp. HI0130]